MSRSATGLPIDVPFGYPTSLIYMDESGSRATASQFFVVGAVKLRESGRFAREIQDVRDRHAFRGEFKFSEITRNTAPAYFDALDALVGSDAHLAACVVDGHVYNPFKGKAAWLAHAEVTAQLLTGCINRRELVSVLLDGISTPRGCSFDDAVRSMVNRRLKSTAVVSAACLDSRSCDILQVADLFAGAVYFERRRAGGLNVNIHSDKAKVAARLGALFRAGGFPDGRSERVNVATYRGRGTTSGLRVVSRSSRAS